MGLDLPDFSGSDVSMLQQTYAFVFRNIADGCDPIPKLERLERQVRQASLRRSLRQGILGQFKVKLVLICFLALFTRAIWGGGVFPSGLYDLLLCFLMVPWVCLICAIFTHLLWDDWMLNPNEWEPYSAALFSGEESEGYQFLSQFQKMEMDTGCSYEAQKINMIEAQALQFSDKSSLKIQAVKDSMGGFELMVAVPSFLALNAVPLWYRFANLF